MTLNVNGGKPEGGSLGTLRTAALIAVLAGALVSVGFLFRAGRNNPQFVVALIAIWVLSPFIALALVSVLSKRWSDLSRKALYLVMLFVTLGSLAIYGADALNPPKTKAAAVFVAVPLASWVLIAVVLPIAVFISRRRSRRKE
ncbi:MAG: hypothetical protein ABI681_04070 [Gemmatimonadales bacterium]